VSSICEKKRKKRSSKKRSIAAFIIKRISGLKGERRVKILFIFSILERDKYKKNKLK
jgi:hypothetical protein